MWGPAALSGRCFGLVVGGSLFAACSVLCFAAPVRMVSPRIVAPPVLCFAHCVSEGCCPARSLCCCPEKLTELAKPVEMPRLCYSPRLVTWGLGRFRASLAA